MMKSYASAVYLASQVNVIAITLRPKPLSALHPSEQLAWYSPTCSLYNPPVMAPTMSLLTRLIRTKHSCLHFPCKHCDPAGFYFSYNKMRTTVNQKRRKFMLSTGFITSLQNCWDSVTWPFLLSLFHFCSTITSQLLCLLLALWM